MHGVPVSQPYAYRAPGRDQGTAHEIQRGVESRSWSRRRRRIQRRSRAAFAAGFATVGVNAVGSSSAASAAACCCAALLSQVLELDEHGGTAAISVVLAKQRRWPRHLAIGVALRGTAGARASARGDNRILLHAKHRFTCQTSCHEPPRALGEPTSAVAMLVLISAAPSLFACAPFTARRVFVGSGPATGRSKVLAGLQPRSRPVAMADSFVDDEVEMMGQKVDRLGHTLRARCRHTARTRNAHGTRTAHTLHTAHTHTAHTRRTRWSHAVSSRRTWA
eukprot:scaffold18011_cov64-Phaeocystis_antarctica.AAC.1